MTSDGSHYEIAIDLAPEAQASGTYSLRGIANTYGYDCNPYTPMDCSGGGGYTCDGTFEITSFDASEVVFSVTLGTCDWGLSPGSPLDGTYTAPRCDD